MVGCWSSWTESAQLFSLCRNLLSARGPGEPQSNPEPATGGTAASAEGQTSARFGLNCPDDMLEYKPLMFL